MNGRAATWKLTMYSCEEEVKHIFKPESVKERQEKGLFREGDNTAI